MNYKALDRKIMWNFRADLYKSARNYGYEYISEAVVGMLREGYSVNEIADIFDTTRYSVHRWLKRWEITLEVS